MSAIAVIPARGNSRRIPRKNIKLFHGKPIIEYSIRAAQASMLFDRVVVSTDDKDTAMIAWDCGASVQVRPTYLSNDDIGTQEVMRHALFGHNFDYACCIYATAPMLTPRDLIEGFYRLLGAPHAYHFIPGWFYWGTTRAFVDGAPLDEKWEPSAYAGLADRYIDVNTPEDWTRAEEMYSELHKDKP